jgi:hypothetical protein
MVEGMEAGTLNSPAILRWAYGSNEACEAARFTLIEGLSLISRQLSVLLTLGQGDDLMSLDTEGHLLVARQLDDEFQLLAGRMH